MSNKSISSKILILIATLALTACGDSQPSLGIIVGDSVMAKLPVDSYRGFLLENKAVGGTRCDSVVDSLLSSGKQGLVILGCGHNGFKPEEIKVQILRAIEYCEINCQKMIIVNINPVLKYAESRPDRLGQTIELNAWIEEQGVEVLDFFSWSMDNQNEEMFHDGLHPTEKGYQKLVQELF